MYVIRKFFYVEIYIKYAYVGANRAANRPFFEGLEFISGLVSPVKPLTFEKRIFARKTLIFKNLNRKETAKWAGFKV